MPDLQARITDGFEKFAVYYHNLFDFPLSFSELIKWTPAKYSYDSKTKIEVVCEKGYCFVSGRAGLPYKRLLRKRYSIRKMLIAKKASNLLSKIPSIKMIAISGSLAMENAKNDSDIDLFIITSKDRLWSTRFLTYLVLKIFNFRVRAPGDLVQKDKLCLNMWFDESDLEWRRPRNIYTAHEIAQLSPLTNKNETYEKFLYKNIWILNFWPNAVKIQKIEDKKQKNKEQFNIFETLIFKLQCLHMKSRMTSEIVRLNRAIFHPQDWSKIILEKLNK